MMMPFGSAFAINNLKITNDQLPLLFMISGIGSLVIMPVIGKVSDKVDKFKVFAFATIWMCIMVVIYTNRDASPLWIVITLNILMMAGVMSRMIPSSALISSVPALSDRGAFMSINASLQQITGGVAAAFAGLIVVQKDKLSPLQHYNTLGYIIIAISLLSMYMLFRISAIDKDKLKEEKL
jgi:predicted MFS family arabinose efflux permease